MRLAEKFIYLPEANAECSFVDYSDALPSLPGRFALIHDQDRKSYGDLVIPETVGVKLLADCGVVVSAGKGLPFGVGDRLMLRPYSGALYLDFETILGVIPRIAFFGVAWKWQDIAIAVQSGDQWAFLTNWVCIKRDSNEASEQGILIANPGSKRQRHRAVVIDAGPSANVKAGDVVYVEDHPNVGYQFKFGALEGLEVLQEIDEDGIMNVWMVANAE